jgi:outer membrane protein assembly factor BamA
MFVRRNLLTVIAFVSGCAHAGPHSSGDERLVKIAFEGNHQLSDKKLVTGLALHRALKRGYAPDPYLVQVDADRIRGEYVRRGYLDVDVRSRVERNDGEATVIYTIEEGPRAATRTVITGLPEDVPVAKIRAQLPLEDGKPFDYDVYQAAKPALLEAVQDAGYAHAQLDASVLADRANHTAIIELSYTPGPKSRFGAVEVTGATGDLAEAVRDRVAFEPGQRYESQALLETQRNLYGFGRFSTVRVQPQNGGGEVVGVQVAVSESARHEVKLGGGVGMEPTIYEVRGRAGYSIAGWPFALDTVTLDLRPAYAFRRYGQEGTPEPRLRALAKLERQDLFWTYAKGTVETGYNYLTVEAYTSTGPLARLGFETPLLTRKVQLRVGWGIEYDWFRHPSPLIDEALQMQLGIDHSERIASYQQGLVIDLRDHPIEPTLGAYADLRASQGTRYAGSAYEYLELVPELRGYVPLVGGAVLAARARYGAIWGDVPATERFFGGGANSQRGFSERQLAPSVTGLVDTRTNGLCTPDSQKCTERTVPYGGAGVIEAGIEARLPIARIKRMPLGVVTFLDGGDVTESPEELDPRNLHWAVGGGLRLLTVVGPVRVDVGYRLNRTGPMDPVPDSHFAYHLTIGEAF